MGVEQEKRILDAAQAMREAFEKRDECDDVLSRAKQERDDAERAFLVAQFTWEAAVRDEY